MNNFTNQSKGGWIFEYAASVHMSPSNGMLSSFRPASSVPPIIVGNGSTIPVSCLGSSLIHTDYKPFLRNVSAVPSLVQELISVRQFTSDNNVSVEFDLLGLSELIRCNSAGDFYPFHGVGQAISTLASSSSSSAFVASVNLRHRRLGHLNQTILSSLPSSFLFHVANLLMNRLYVRPVNVGSM